MACSTHVYHLMEMEGKLKNDKLAQFAIPSADATNLLHCCHFAVQNN